MGIINCILNQNWQCLSDWSLSNILWWILQALFVIVFLKFFIPTIQAPFLAKKILKNNRCGKGSGYGAQAADTYTELWRADRNYSNTLTQGNLEGNGSRNTQYGRIVEQYLVPLKLAEIFEEHSTKAKKVRVIKNFRNTITYKLVVLGLVCKYDDKLQFYKK